VCLHSDTDGALELAHAVAGALRAEGVALAPAVRP
jgi:lactam utilization protein B